MTNIAGISTHHIPGWLWAALQRAVNNPFDADHNEWDWFAFYGLTCGEDGFRELTPEAREFARYLEETRWERARTGMLRPGEEKL